MPNIENYRKEKQKMLILLCIEGLLFYGVAFFLMKGGNFAAAMSMIMVPLLMVPFVKFTALSTKVEILKELQDKGQVAFEITSTPPDKQFLALRLVSILIVGITVLGAVWFIVHKLIKVIYAAGLL